MLDHEPVQAEVAFRTAAELQGFAVNPARPAALVVSRADVVAASLLAQGGYVGAEREATAVLRSWKLDPVTLEIRSRAELSAPPR